VLIYILVDVDEPSVLINNEPLGAVNAGAPVPVYISTVPILTGESKTVFEADATAILC
jgi:hypothetical protein